MAIKQERISDMDSNQLLQERIRKMHAAIARVAGTELPSPLKEQLDSTSLAVGEPDSDAPLEHLVTRIDKPDWRLRLGEHLGHALEGLAVANYHVERVAELEAGITATIQSLDDPPPSSSVGFRSRKLDAEYQAFVFALRRAIEYFAAAVAAYFKTNCSRIRNVRAAIEGCEPHERSAGAATAIQKGLSRLPDVLTQGNARSIRDRMAHWEFVAAGSLQAVWDETGRLRVTGIAGGGEELPGLTDPNARLSAVLRAQFDVVADMFVNTYSALKLLP
jgi:hypothetical protein